MTSQRLLDHHKAGHKTESGVQRLRTLYDENSDTQKINKLLYIILGYI